MKPKSSISEAVKIKLTKARASLILGHPFFGALAMRLILVEDNSIPTLAVDGKRIFYNAEFVNNLSMELTKSAFAHEVGHCIFSHIGRRGARKPGKWNQAGDYVINDMIKQAGFELGEGWLYNPIYAGMTSDAVYAALPDPPDGGDGPGPGEPGGPLDKISDGTPDPTQQKVNERNWQIATIQAANAAKQAGKLPGGLERFIKDMMKPQIDWKQRLRQFMTQIVHDDYDWSRPNKKLLQYGIVMPTLYNEAAGEIGVFIDDSGSVNNNILNAFGSETRAIWEDLKPSIMHLMFCDSQIGGRYEVTPDDEFPVLKIHGGGGTDFNPPFVDLAERDIKPQCAIYLTDGYGPFPPTPPDYPVLWVMTSDVIAPWGETIPIEV